jgi:hypothetical protein
MRGWQTCASCPLAFLFSEIGAAGWWVLFDPERPIFSFSVDNYLMHGMPCKWSLLGLASLASLTTSLVFPTRLPLSECPDTSVVLGIRAFDIRNANKVEVIAIPKSEELTAGNSITCEELALCSLIQCNISSLPIYAVNEDDIAVLGEYALGK